MNNVIPCVILALASVSVCADDQVPADLSAAEYTAAISESVSSIFSFDCIYEIQFGENETPKKWRFARQGEMWHRSEISHEDDGDAERTAGVCYDGEYTYTLVVRKFPDGSEKWRHVEVQDGNPEPPTHVFPDAMIGSRLPNMGCSILQAWESAPPELEQAPDGVKTLVSRAVPSRLADTLGIEFDVQYTMNTSKELQPSSILITRSGKQAKTWFQHWVIDGWSEFNDHASNHSRWFPTRGKLLQSGKAPTITLAVNSVNLNSDLPMSLFRPEDAPAGTLLLNGTSGGVSGQLAVVGSDRQLDNALSQVVADAKAASPDQPRPVSTVLLAVNGALLAGVVVWLLFRKRPAK